MTRVKICGIRDAAAADAACEAGADALGFVFYEPSPRAVTMEQARELVAALPPLVSAVGLFVDPAPRAVEHVLKHCPIDVLQFHGSEDREFCESFGRPYIKAVSMGPHVDVAATVAGHPRARAFLFDAWQPDLPGGTGEVFDWSRIGVQERPWLLAGGLHQDNVARAIEEVSPPAVDVSGGVESGRGVKDPDRIRAFMKAVRNADAVRSVAAGSSRSVVNARESTDTDPCPRGASKDAVA